eukprot:scaffold3596_cov126-Cylindrotheca_fusiformis.AAC.7
MRRGSAIGLLNADDDAAYGSNAQRYNEQKLKGSFVNRLKQNVGQRIEAVQDTLDEIPTKTSKFSMSSFKNSAKNVFMGSNSNENGTPVTMQGEETWASMDDFDDSFEFDTTEDKSFDFDNGFVQDVGKGDDDDDDNNSIINPTGSDGSLSDSDFVVTGSALDLGIKARPEEGSKARSQRRNSLLGPGPGPAPLLGQSFKSIEDSEFDNPAKPDSILQFSPENGGTKNEFMATNALLDDVADGTATNGTQHASRRQEKRGSGGKKVRRSKSATDGGSSSKPSNRRRSGRRPSADAETMARKGLGTKEDKGSSSHRKPVRNHGSLRGNRRSLSADKEILTDSTDDSEEKNSSQRRHRRVLSLNGSRRESSTDKKDGSARRGVRKTGSLSRSRRGASADREILSESPVATADRESSHRRHRRTVSHGGTRKGSSSNHRRASKNEEENEKVDRRSPPQSSRSPSTRKSSAGARKPVRSSDIKLVF